MNTIEEIKQRLDIVDVVSQYVSLKKAGRNFTALCPFHTEKTPSFFVFPETQRWHCFGACGSGGDLFSFLMKRESLDFSEALKQLAQKSGVKLPERRGEKDRGLNRYHELNGAAAEYFHRELLTSPSAEMPRRYLEGRGIAQATIENFQLGFSLNSSDALSRHLIKEGYSEEELLAIGLARSGGDGGIHDMFRNRLMFPIRDERGHVVGFGARALDESLPKYINSPQSPLFDKGSVLYGIDRARASIRTSHVAVIVEGYMDVLMAHQHGFDNVVASMGTALTERQVKNLQRLAPEVVMALDADTAGDDATLRSLESSWHIFDRVVISSRGRLDLYQRTPNPLIKIIELPRGEDPDEVIKQGVELWQELVKGAQPLLDYLMEAVITRTNLEGPGAKMAVVERLFPLIAKMEDPFEQDRYIQKLAQRLEVSEATLKVGLSKLPRRRAKRSTIGEGGKAAPGSTPALTGSDPVEEHCLCLLLRYPELEEIGKNLSHELFRHTENREIFDRWLHNRDVGGLQNSLDGPLREHLESLLSSTLPPTATEEERKRAFSACIRRLEERRLRELKTQEAELLSQETVVGEELAELQQKAVEVNAELRKIFTP